MKKFLSNKPWKQWRTRKMSFLYMMFVGTIAILLSGLKTSFSTEWLSLTLKYCEFVVGTGTLIIICPCFAKLKDVIKGEDEC